MARSVSIAIVALAIVSAGCGSSTGSTAGSSPAHLTAAAFCAYARQQEAVYASNYKYKDPANSWKAAETLWTNLAAKAPRELKSSFDTLARESKAFANGSRTTVAPADVPKIQQATKYLYNTCKIRPPSTAP